MNPYPSEEVMTMGETRIEIDIPCDVQDEDELGMPYALLTEAARDPSRIVPGAIVITADEEDPVCARVHSLTQQGNLSVAPSRAAARPSARVRRRTAPIAPASA
jgi:hypothetical protein